MPSPILLSSDPVSADSLSFPTTPTSTTHHHHSTLPLESTLPSSPPSLPLPLDEHHLNSLSKLNKTDEHWSTSDPTQTTKQGTQQAPGRETHAKELSPTSRHE
ncbi:hypothetical protein PCASD_12224 [Puccinia coronata f. sp. avenae]|uniref:Uncharacterized protein n=1 Tax=Puccinia coronata f. sp. avenae TaxID=200324 RepID=A0A2N5TAW8_9BASI|nr:hypothetical protein PCASD_12224 [Puccinia coronata f. sp. avenae]